MEETLLDYLRRENPTVAHIDIPNRSKSTTRCRTYSRPKWIARWEDFNTETIHGMYADILRHVETRDRIRLREIDLRVRNETGFEKVVDKWNEKIVFKALEETSECMGRDDLIYIVPGVKAQYVQGATKKYRPDWAAIAMNSQGETGDILPKNLLPGDTKYSKDWTSASVKEGDCRHMVDPRHVPGWFWPVAQVYTYCYRLQRRYAYIITDAELVLFRIGPLRDSPPEPSPVSQNLEIKELDVDGKIEFVSIPWANGRNEMGVELGEPNGLSVNTALWWLHLQAASNNSIRWTYPPLQNDALSYTPLEHDISLSRNDSFRPSADDAQTERAPSEVYDDSRYQLSFMEEQEAAQFSVPESSAASIGPSSRRRTADRNQTASSFGSTAANSSFVSHSSVTSSKNRVEKSKGKTAKRGRPTISNSGNKRGSSKKS
ncbi:hypothetical protein P171DRAFT_433707 [Karstenula rhodostoma CBS 690.94]|uniref:Uncharacterized protein n=1 Tax=Karstenula rhodostoma CBS 690.94 TaxID=1392251 RepID=A0A9P4PBV6_9PLEO|nr:hypothetical protein P171DRAFT_433707 [Karstenula rhodostoma CBS 690.94]